MPLMSSPASLILALCASKVSYSSCTFFILLYMKLCRLFAKNASATKAKSKFRAFFSASLVMAKISSSLFVPAPINQFIVGISATWIKFCPIFRLVMSSSFKNSSLNFSSISLFSVASAIDVRISPL